MSELVESVEPRRGAGRGVVAGLAIAAVVGGVVSAVGAVSSPRQFGYSYLAAMAFAVSVGLGSLFWVMIHHLVDAGWSVVLRRLLENLSSLLIWSGLLLFPLLLVVDSVYAWTGDASADPILRAKRAYLNVPFFSARSALYAVVWGMLAGYLLRTSRRQDGTGDPSLTLKMKRASAGGMYAIAITSTFAAFDWLMSLDYKWYSTIFGVYYWAGSILAGICAVTLLAIGLRAAGVLGRTITVEHLHDLGKLMLGFTIFWAYIAFCQYFLIWYGNQPEETEFYLLRRQGSWNLVSWSLAIGHFAVPFALLLPRASKRNPRLLGFVAAWLLAFHYIDMYWLALPNLHRGGVRPHWLDASTLAAVVAVCGLVVARACLSGPLVPIRDPRLAESLAYRDL